MMYLIYRPGDITSKQPLEILSSSKSRTLEPQAISLGFLFVLNNPMVVNHFIDCGKSQFMKNFPYQRKP